MAVKRRKSKKSSARRRNNLQTVAQLFGKVADGDVGVYPKITVELGFFVEWTGGATVTFDPDQVFAQVSVIHQGGLIGEYEWLRIFGRDLVMGEDQANFVVRESLVPPLRLPPLFYQLHVKSKILRLRQDFDTLEYFLRVRIVRTEAANRRSILVYDQKYRAPRGGLCEVSDMITPEVPRFEP